MNGIEVVATTADAAFAVDLDGRILAWNEAAEYCLGYRGAEVRGRRCWRVLAGLDPSSNRYCGESCAVRDMARRGEPVHRTEVFLRNAAGERTRTSISILVVRGERGRELVHLVHPLRPRTREAAVARDRIGVGPKAPLSARQLEVLELLGNGKRTQEIAELLCISPATARHHVQHILTRLKVHSRLEAVSLARRIGLL